MLEKDGRFIEDVTVDWNGVDIACSSNLDEDHPGKRALALLTISRSVIVLVLVARSVPDEYVSK